MIIAPQKQGPAPADDRPRIVHFPQAEKQKSRNASTFRPRYYLFVLASRGELYIFTLACEPSWVR